MSVKMEIFSIRTLTRLHLCVPSPLLSSLLPSSWHLSLTPKPHPASQSHLHTPKSKFPSAARSAECCCLLSTQKFAEAVSCPQTSAPWSGGKRGGKDRTGAHAAERRRGEEERGEGGLLHYVMYGFMCAQAHVRAHICVWVNNHSNRCFVSFWALY